MAISSEDRAQQWIDTHIYNDGGFKIAPDQLQFIINLVYFSYMRSQTTVTIQPLAIRALNGLWYGWHNIIGTRLNPSQQIPHPICNRQEERVNQEFWNSYRHHRTAALSYAHAVNNIIQDTVVTDPAAQRAIKGLRAIAHKVITTALTDLKQHITNLVFGKKDPCEDITRTTLSQFVVTYIPHLAQQSFIDANKLTLAASIESWDMFIKIQEISNYTWRITEQARAHLYHTVYRKLYALMSTSAIEPSFMTIIYNEIGFIPEDERDMVLPEL
jgi:hypothetical protein